VTTLVFLKLGGSLITDKSRAEAARPDVISRLAREIGEALDARPDLSLLIGHGSGSFGHSVAARYATHRGVAGREAWKGFARVAVVAAELNQLVLSALDHAGVPVFRVQPSASARCRNGELVELAVHPVRQALENDLVAVVYGDVAMDDVLGGTIISTETIFAYLAERLRPQRLLLAGDYPGVVDGQGAIIPHVTRASLSLVGDSLAGSAHPDVTGGMAAKVEAMLALCERVPGLSVQIYSGDEPGMIGATLLDDSLAPGTQLTA
jgi:isopentenyl phosphate kinase